MHRFSYRLILLGALAPLFVWAGHPTGSGEGNWTHQTSLISTGWAADHDRQLDQIRSSAERDRPLLKVASTSRNRTIKSDMTSAQRPVAVASPAAKSWEVDKEKPSGGTWVRAVQEPWEVVKEKPSGDAWVKAVQEPWDAGGPVGGRIVGPTKPQRLALWLRHFSGMDDAKIAYSQVAPRAPSASDQVAALQAPREIVRWLKNYEGGGPVAADLQRKKVHSKLRPVSGKDTALRKPQDIAATLAQYQPRMNSTTTPGTLLAAVPWNERFNVEVKSPTNLLAGFEKAKNGGTDISEVVNLQEKAPPAHQLLTAKVPFEERYNYIIELTKGTRRLPAKDYVLADAAVTISEALDIAETASTLENLWAELRWIENSPSGNWDLAANPADQLTANRVAQTAQIEPQAIYDAAMVDGNTAPPPGPVEIKKLAPLPEFQRRYQELQQAKIPAARYPDITAAQLRKRSGTPAPLSGRVEIQSLGPLKYSENIARSLETSTGSPTAGEPSRGEPQFQQLASLPDEIIIDSQPMPEDEMRDLRGGINLGNGMVISFVGHVTAEQDGVLVFDTLLNFPAAAMATLEVNGVSVENVGGALPNVVAADGGVLLSVGDIVNSPQILADFPSGNTTIINSTSNIALSVTSSLEINIGNADALFSNGLTPSVQNLANTLNNSIIPR